ncbi:FAD-dependent monooxygenase [Massilia sp. W12]|uniref:FAD-dependent oxidoreductase n=1 Tax=Massilia sp. W12 TaxID=3126507 RepID=UPI0030D28BBF
MSQRIAHAVVIGASMAGLMAARILSDYAERVTLIERDAPSQEEIAARKGVPQSWHPHVLLSKGEALLGQWFPGLAQELIAQGARRANFPGDCLWMQEGVYKLRSDTGLHLLMMSRPLLEGVTRQRVLQLPGVTFAAGCEVRGLLCENSADQQRICGVRFAARDAAPGEEQSVAADLVIDCSGRSAQTRHWLKALGLPEPQVSEVTAKMAYTTRRYLDDGKILRDSHAILCMPVPPLLKRSGVVLRQENGEIIVTMCGWLGEQAPRDEAGFLAYAQSLASPLIAQLLEQATPCSEFYSHQIPSNQHRHYEKMRDLPRGLLALGDAFFSFNPVYGQGMSAAALQVEQLQRCLQEYGPAHADLAPVFFKRAAKAMRAVWMMAVGEDFRFQETSGRKLPGTDLINRYVSAVHRLNGKDETSLRALCEVMTLMRPPSALFAPGIVARVVRDKLGA